MVSESSIPSHFVPFCGGFRTEFQVKSCISLFVPQVDETLCHDSQGQQIDVRVNSVNGDCMLFHGHPDLNNHTKLY